MAARIRRLLRIAAGSLVLSVYVWISAVRNAGRVKRRKRARRAARLRR